MSTEVTALYWDIGGVILSNGWDDGSRSSAARQFGFDLSDFEARHAKVFPAYEKGHLTLAEYFDQTVFAHPQSFSREQLTEFIFSQSSENLETHALLDRLTAEGGYLLSVINNEGRELNEYRIAQFGLARNFTAFFSSCYVGLLKPDPAIYRLALDVTRRSPGESVFIDDREENLVPARRLGMRTIHFQNPAQLRAELASHGISVARD